MVNYLICKISDTLNSAVIYPWLGENKLTWMIIQIYSIHWLLSLQALKEGFEFFCNKRGGTTTAELLAIFCDSLLNEEDSQKLGDGDKLEDAFEKVPGITKAVSIGHCAQVILYRVPMEIWSIASSMITLRFSWTWIEAGYICSTYLWLSVGLLDWKNFNCVSSLGKMKSPRHISTDTLLLIGPGCNNSFICRWQRSLCGIL